MLPCRFPTSITITPQARPHKVTLSIVCTQLNGFSYSRWLNSSNWPIDGTLTGTKTPVHSGPCSNGNKWILPIFQSFENGASLTNSFVLYPGYPLRWWGLTPQQRCSLRIPKSHLTVLENDWGKFNLKLSWSFSSVVCLVVSHVSCDLLHEIGCPCLS